VENASYFRAIRLEKMMMSLILSLIIGVAAFNIVASLVMVVTDKTSDIAILRTLGMGPNGVVRVFFIQGAVIGWLGVLLGVIFGVVLAMNVPTIVPWLEQLFGFQIMPGDVYYVTDIPSDIYRYSIRHRIFRRDRYCCRCLCPDFPCHTLSGPPRCPR
jgi:lipoprotein-releasing system permease protein